MAGNAPIQSIQRAVRILYLLAGREEGFTIQQIADQMGVKANTAYRFIRTLEADKMVERREAPLRFFIGPALAELHHLDEQRHLMGKAGDILLSSQAQHPSASFVFVEMEQDEFYTRLRASSERPGILIRHRNSAHVLHETASSLLYLAHSSPLEARRLEQKYPFAIYGKPIWKTRDELKRFLAEIRRNGYCLYKRTTEFVELTTVSVPVFGVGNEMIAAVGGYIPGGKLSKRQVDRLIELCRTCAQQLSDIA